MKRRLHQLGFREKVMEAYRRRCTICNLGHVELLDSAHIIPDSRPHGHPMITNGLSLCKIHHAAYDRNVIGISADYDVRVREDILEEIDGPMLQYGIKEMQGRSLILPRVVADRPDREGLDYRYRQFLGT